MHNDFISLVKKGTLNKAEQLLDAYRKSITDNPQKYIYIVIYYIYSQKYAKSAELLSQLKKNYGDKYFNIDIDRMFAYLYWKNKEYERTKNIIEQLPFEKTEFIGFQYMLLANIGWITGNLTEIEGLYKKSLQYFEEYGFILEQRHVLNNLGLLYLTTDRTEKSRNFFIDAFKLSQNIESFVERALSTSSLAYYYDTTGDTKEALNYYNQSLDLYMTLNDLKGMFSIKNNIANIYSKIGELKRAYNIYYENLELAKHIGENKYIATAYNNLAIIQHLQGNLNQSLDSFFNALELARELRQSYEVMIILGNIGNIYNELGNIDLGIEYLLQSLNLSIEQNDKKQESLCLYNLAMINIETKRERDTTKNYLNRLKKLSETTNIPNLDIRYKLANALYLKNSKSLMDVANSKSILKNIIDDTTINHENKITALFHYCDFLIFEFKTTENSELLDELNNLLDRLENISSNQSSSRIYAKVLLLRARLSMLTDDFDKVKAYLTTVDQISEANGMIKLKAIVESEIDQYMSRMSKWKHASVAFEEKFNDLMLDDYIKNIIAQSFEYTRRTKTFHYEEGDHTLCGIPLDELREYQKQYGLHDETKAKCSKCRKILLQRNMMKIATAYLMYQACPVCGNTLTESKARELLEEHIEKFQGTFNQLLKVNTPLKKGLIMWYCDNPTCDNDNPISFQLESIKEF